jgi:hypothetical protein
LGLDEIWHHKWQVIIDELHKAHIHIREGTNESAWTYNFAGGQYVVKLGYKSL